MMQNNTQELAYIIIMFKDVNMFLFVERYFDL